MDTDKFVVGSRLHHPVHGAGTVTFIGTDYVGIAFDGTGEALIRRTALEESMRPVCVPVEAPPDALPWPASTFIPEVSGAQHFMGSHWKPFFHDAADIADLLPQILREAMPQFGYGSVERNAQRGRPLPDDWPIGQHLVWPYRTEGLSLILHADGGTNRLVSVFPFTTNGVQQTVMLHEVHVWPGGLEAQVVASWGEAEIAFFDNQYLINRSLYEAGMEYDFILAGIAYTARPADELEWQVERHPDEVAWANRHLEPGEVPHEASVTLKSTGMAVLLPAEKLDRDDYNFRAPVKSVEPFRQQWLGQQGWRVRATIMRSGDQDADLDIFITRKAWEGDQPPRVGQDIEGYLWLQGRLWQVL